MLFPRQKYLALLLALCFSLAVPTLANAEEQHAAARKELFRQIEKDVRETSYYLNKSELDPQVLAALSKVPRHEFVDNALMSLAYENRPLPIGHGQTISQPYIVAIMTDLLSVGKGDRVLEIGTGSGYQAAILAEIVGEVYSIEIIEELGKSAEARLERLGYENIHLRLGDGYYGWQEMGPFDAIIVTAAASHIPPPLIAQLKPGGKMMIPVGGPFMTQQLVVVEKDGNGAITTHQLLPVRFVPLTGKH